VPLVLEKWSYVGVLSRKSPARSDILSSCATTAEAFAYFVSLLDINFILFGNEITYGKKKYVRIFLSDRHGLKFIIWQKFVKNIRFLEQQLLLVFLL
jgi:hypothetical protein